MDSVFILQSKLFKLARYQDVVRTVNDAYNIGIFPFKIQYVYFNLPNCFFYLWDVFI
jgi:hypothetical protein